MLLKLAASLSVGSSYECWVVVEHDTVPNLFTNPESSVRAVVVEAGLDDSLTA